MAPLVRLEKVKGLVSGIVFGPVNSRRYGRSLGINPLPPDRKLCMFDCPYCECGSTSRAESGRLDRQPFPPAAGVIAAVRRALEFLAESNETIDSLTLTGNGETTLHPDFEKIIGGVVELRDRHVPKAQTVVLTNGTRLSVRAVRRALERVDRCAVKLDAGRESTFQRINRPLGPVTLEEITAAAAHLPRVIVQTFFVRGVVDNTSDAEIEKWIERVVRIHPLSVQIYSLDRKPAEAGLVAVPRRDLERIAARLVGRTRLSVEVF